MYRGRLKRWKLLKPLLPHTKFMGEKEVTEGRRKGDIAERLKDGSITRFLSGHKSE